MQNTLLKDRDWRSIDGEPCRVLEFRPLSRVEHLNVDSKTYIRTGEVVPIGDVVGPRGVPYAFITFDCPKLPAGSEGAITHKLDFIHLWLVFKERGLKEDEEVIVFWTRKPLRGLARMFAVFMPKLSVMVFKKGSYERLIDRAATRYDLPIEEWRPHISR